MPKTIHNPSNFRCWLWSGVSKISQRTISTICWIRNKLIYLSLAIRTIRGLSAAVMIQFSAQNKEQLSNLLHRLRKPHSATRSWNRQWTQWGQSCRFLPDNNNVLVHYGNFTIWLCHSELKLFWNRTKIGNVCPIVPIVSWRVFRALTKVGYWGWIRDSKYKRLPNIYNHCALTDARTLDISHHQRQIYRPLLPIQQIV